MAFKKYLIYYELGGHKMKSTVISECESGAKHEIEKKIIFHGVVEQGKAQNYQKAFDKIFKTFDDLMSIFDKKKN